MHLGSEYQVRVAAWLAVEMLAEGHGLFATGDRVSMLRGETQESVDDLLVGTVSEHYGFIQAKRKVSFSDRIAEPLGVVIECEDRSGRLATRELEESGFVVCYVTPG
jgi:hypothetical protein